VVGELPRIADQKCSNIPCEQYVTGACKSPLVQSTGELDLAVSMTCDSQRYLTHYCY
jgi:hypothetical protein